MKKTLLAGACIVTAGLLVVGCGNESGTPTTKVTPKPPPAPSEKIESPEAAVSKGLVASKEAPPDMPKKKAPSDK